MPYGPIPARFALPVGWRSGATTFWGACPAEGEGLDEHVSRVDVDAGDGPIPEGITHVAYELADTGQVQFGPCERCGTPWDGARGDLSSSGQVVYDTPSGQLEPGCLWWGKCHTFNCPMFGPPRFCFGGFCEFGEHLYGMLPDGHMWDIDSRASNCTRPGEPHRCWVRHFDPQTETAAFTVDKNGDTCSAGAGSIDDGTYHGFLTNGAFTAG